MATKKKTGYGSPKPGTNMPKPPKPGYGSPKPGTGMPKPPKPQKKKKSSYAY